MTQPLSREDIKDPKIAELFDALQSGSLTEHLSNVAVVLEASTEQMKQTIVEGKPVSMWMDYEAHLQAFLQLHEKGFDETDFLSSINLDKDKVIQEYGAKLKAGTFSAESLMTDLIQKTDSQGAGKMQDALYYSKNSIERLKRTLEMHDVVNNSLPQQTNPVVKRYLLLNLYRDAFEIYLILLIELYERVTGKEKNDTSDFYDFFRAHPPLYDKEYNKLRNDVSHILFNEREKYSDEELHKMSNNLLRKSFTCLIARNIQLINFYKKSAETITNFLAKFPRQ